jgi:hypothetical protein
MMMKTMIIIQIIIQPIEVKVETKKAEMVETLQG